MPRHFNLIRLAPDPIIPNKLFLSQNVTVHLLNLINDNSNLTKIIQSFFTKTVLSEDIRVLMEF